MPFCGIFALREAPNIPWANNAMRSQLTRQRPMPCPLPSGLYRRLRPLTGSADLPALETGSARGLREKSRYRRWGIAPRPENKANINYQMGRNQGAMARPLPQCAKRISPLRSHWGISFPGPMARENRRMNRKGQGVTGRAAAVHRSASAANRASTGSSCRAGSGPIGHPGRRGPGCCAARSGQC
jgi:hypothetical protein